MKKHKTSKKKELKQMNSKKKKWSTKLWVSLFFIAIMVLSTVGYFANNDSNISSVKYNNNIIFQDPKTYEWYLEQNGKKVYFTNPPDALEGFDVDKNAAELFKNKKLFYGTYDPNSEFRQTFSKIEYELEQGYFKDTESYFVYAFNDTNSYGKPIMDCSNATSDAPVIFFNEVELGVPTSITVDNNCIMFNSNSDTGFILLRDKLMYTVYGVYE